MKLTYLMKLVYALLTRQGGAMALSKALSRALSKVLALYALALCALACSVLSMHARELDSTLLESGLYLAKTEQILNNTPPPISRQDISTTHTNTNTHKTESSTQKSAINPKTQSNTAQENTQATTQDTPTATRKAWLFGDILHPYVSLGYVSTSTLQTQSRQSMSKEVATCPNQQCSGDTTGATYQGSTGSGISVELGAEYYFDKYHILGIRLFGEMTKRKASLGDQVAGSAYRDGLTNNLQAAYERCKQLSATWDENTKNTNCGILILGNSTDPNTPNTKVEDSFTFQQTPDAARSVIDSGEYLSFALGVDAMLNLPIDAFILRILTSYDGFDFVKNPLLSRLQYFRVGLFVGGGAEFARLSQGDPNNKTWRNEAAAKGKASNLNDAFFAAGSGGFFRYGVSVYLTRFARLNFGFKHSFYEIAQERWYGFDGAKFDKNAQNNVGAIRPNDPWSEALFRQRFAITKDKEWFINLALSF